MFDDSSFALIFCVACNRDEKQQMFLSNFSLLNMSSVVPLVDSLIATFDVPFSEPNDQSLSYFLNQRLQHHQKSSENESKEETIPIQIESLIQSEVRQHKVAFIEFACPQSQHSIIESFTNCVTSALKHVQHGLYVLVQCPQSIHQYSNPQDVIHLLLTLYQIIDRLSQKTHGLLFDSRIIIISNQSMYNHTISTLTKSEILKLSDCSRPLIMDKLKLLNDDKNQSVSSPVYNRYNEVVFGGTFDHIHSGHKVMVTIAALMCSDTLYIGLSIDQLLKHKKYSNMLQSFDLRKQSLLEFIECTRPGLKVVIESLNDLYGPSIYESIEALVCSKETIGGANKVNEKRVELKRNPLELIVIDLVESNEIDHKVSSTDIRCFAEKYEFLKQNWNRLMVDIIGIDQDGDDANTMNQFIEEWWWILFNFYQQSQRYYHTLDHIQHLLKNCTRYSAKLENVTVVLLAIWFHDVIYDPTLLDNELQSIEVFKVFMDHLRSVFGDGHELSAEESQKVMDYIEATIKHQIEVSYANDEDIKWFLDFDLAILGEQEAVYDKYARHIRMEYIHVQSPLYEEKRSEVMQRFLQRKDVYFTKIFKTTFEPIARRNVKKEVGSLLKR